MFGDNHVRNFVTLRQGRVRLPEEFVHFGRASSACVHDEWGCLHEPSDIVHLHASAVGLRLRSVLLLTSFVFFRTACSVVAASDTP